MDTPRTRILPNPIFELMTVLRTPKYRVRVWSRLPVEVTHLKMGPDPEVMVAWGTLRPNMLGDPKTIALMMYKIIGERLEAIEITDTEGNGGLFYPDWK